jgi:hypothetical protein
MSRVLEYQIKGKSDVEQVVGRAKASVGQLQQFTNAVSKKLSEFGKDFAMGYLAPIMLLNKAIDFIGRKIEERHARIEEAMALAAEAEDFSQFDPTTVFLAKRFKAEDESKKKRMQMEDAAEETTRRFLETDKRGIDLLNESEKAKLRAGTSLSVFAADKGVQAALVKLLQGEAPAAAPAKKIAEDMTKATSVSGNVIGVGQSPVIAAMNETNDLLRSIDQKLTPAQPALAPDPNLTKKAPTLYPQFK